MNTNTDAQPVGLAPFISRTWNRLSPTFNWVRPTISRAREHKLWLLVVGVILGTLIILALMRFLRPSHVVPVNRYPFRSAEPYRDGRIIFPATAVGNFPVYPVGAGGQVMPYVNRTKRDLVVKEAYFIEKNAGRPIVPGVLIDAYEVRFEPKHFDASQRRWARKLSDLTLPANSETRVVVRLVDPARAGQRLYGTLVLRVANGDLLQFESAQVIVQED